MAPHADSDKPDRVAPNEPGLDEPSAAIKAHQFPKSASASDRLLAIYADSQSGHQSLPTSTKNVNISRVVLLQLSESSESLASMKEWLVISLFAILWIQRPFG